MKALALLNIAFSARLMTVHRDGIEHWVFLALGVVWTIMLWGELRA